MHYIDIQLPSRILSLASDCVILNPVLAIPDVDYYDWIIWILVKFQLRSVLSMPLMLPIGTIAALSVKVVHGREAHG
jgi:hypothetical protein